MVSITKRRAITTQTDRQPSPRTHTAHSLYTLLWSSGDTTSTVQCTVRARGCESTILTDESTESCSVC